MKPLPADPVFRGILLAALTSCAGAKSTPTPEPEPAPEPASEPTAKPVPPAKLEPPSGAGGVYEACSMDAWSPGYGVTPAEAIDGLQHRNASERVDKGKPRVTEVLPVCTKASDAGKCAADVGSFAIGKIRSDFGQIGETKHDFVYTRGDEAGHVDSRDALIAWLGPIDSGLDARTVAWADGYTPSCDKEPEETDGGWKIIATKRVNDCPITFNGYDLIVTSTGELKVDQEHAGEPGKACIGRLPPGMDDVACGTGVGEWLASVAHLEAAAVVAFDQLIAELHHHGAPEALVAAARDAREDEVRHAVAMTALAQRYGASIEPCTVTPSAIRSLAEIAHDNAREGLVREAYGAAVGLWQAKHAADPVVRATLREIALDEVRHAELSRALDTWLRSRLDADLLGDLDAATARSRRELRPASELPEGVRELVGVPPLDVAQTLFDSVVA